ncbi:hypothetical protein TU76_14760 [Pseudomonas psychrophila]|nr:hypothetical protein TU76_14760 [Pseudomonas psychrophila]
MRALRHPLVFIFDNVNIEDITRLAVARCQAQFQGRAARIDSDGARFTPTRMRQRQGRIRELATQYPFKQG